MWPKQHTVVLQKRFHQQTFGIYVGDDVPSGLYIVTIVPNSPAADANIQPGDRILAINGQLVSSMSTNPKEMLGRLANNTSSLTLSIQSSNILQSLSGLIANDFSHANKPYVSNEKVDANHDIERYVKSILRNERIHQTHSSVKPNEYSLTSDYHSRRPHRHRPRKRRHYVSKHTQTSMLEDQPQTSMFREQPQTLIPDEQRVDLQPLSSQRSIPSMGTSHVILRNSQLSSKDARVQEPEEIKPLSNFEVVNTSNNNTAIYKPEPAPVVERSSIVSSRLSSNRPTVSQSMPRTDQLNNRGPPINVDGIREVRIRRSPNFQGFGFHLNYNTMYYLIDRIEPDGPSAGTGLRARDVILKINNQSTVKMPHSVFVQIVTSSVELLLLVQSFTDYARLHPEVTVLQQRQPRNAPTIETDDSSSDYKQTTRDKSHNILSRTLSRLKSR